VATKDELGRRGEDLAVEYLRGTGLVVLSRNWRCRDGEIDVVATDSSRLVVCEVKTRSGTGFGEPAESVSRQKAARIRRVTPSLARRSPGPMVRDPVDVVAIVAPPGGEITLQHYESAF